MSLPDALLKRAFHSASGELAWTKDDAVSAARALCSLGMAVLGGELWLVDEEGHIRGSFQPAKGGPPAIYAWTVEPAWRQDRESWRQFCYRAATFTELMLRTPDVEAEIEAALRPQVRYNLTFIALDEYDSP